MPKLTQAEIYNHIGAFRLNYGRDRDFNLFEVMELSVDDTGIDALLKVKDAGYYFDNANDATLESHHMLLINNIMHIIYSSFNKIGTSGVVSEVLLKCKKPIFIDQPFIFSSTLKSKKRNRLNFSSTFGDNCSEIDYKALAFKNENVDKMFFRRFYRRKA